MAIEWAKLVAQGRAKDIGIPWSEEEATAIHTLKIPIEYVRKGILTIADYEKVKGSIPADKSKDELIVEAKKEGIPVTPEATKESLKKVIRDKKEIKVKAKPVKMAVKAKRSR